jgi:uncharacterized protein
MSTHKPVVEAYFEGFRQGDRAAILALLTDDVVWDLPGYTRRVGRAEFDQEIENDAFTGRPTLNLDRLIEEGDPVVAIGTGEASLRSGETHRFAYCDVFTFAGGLIRRVESYLVPLTSEVTV